MIAEISKNFQIMYYDRSNVLEVSLNLLSFGYEQFKASFTYQNIDKLFELCESFSLVKAPDRKLLSGFAFNKLIDCIRITICFENYFKSQLLNRDSIIHKLDKNVFPDLYKKQFIRPEILRISCPYFDYRNSLHLYMQETGSLGQFDYLNFKQLIDFVNEQIVKKFNELSSQSGMTYKLNEL